MKKVFTLLCGLFCLAGTVIAATVDDLAVCKHSYVLKFGDYINGGKPGKGVIFGDGYFLDVTGGSVHTKGAVDLSDETFCDGKYLQYAEYGLNSNTWRLKNGQDVIAMKVTAGSKIIILGEKHASRGPQITDAAPANNKMQGNVLGTSKNTAETGGSFEWIADDDRLIYIGSDGGDYYVSYLIVEANEAPGTPLVKVGPQTFEGGLWFREVTCTPKPVVEDGEELPTFVTYTTDGTAPNFNSPRYTEPIKCYKDMVVKFQAYDAEATGESGICQNADYDAAVSFSFDAPALEANGATFTITSPYEGAKNYYVMAGDTIESNGTTLTESASVTAYSQIVNGTYATFTTKSVSADVYVLNDIKEEKNITVSGTAVVDEEATASSTTGPVYVVENGAITADKMDFFVKNLTFGALANLDAAKAKYQVPAGQEAYIQMSNTNISFSVAEGDSVEITVVCTKNSCKNIDEEITQGKVSGQDTISANRQCFVNVDGTNYGGEDLALNPEGNVITFRVGVGVHTFQKYSGTGNILISAIKFVPMIGAGVQNLAAAEQKVAAKKVFRNGRLVIETANGTFNVAGVRVK